MRHSQKESITLVLLAVALRVSPVEETLWRENRPYDWGGLAQQPTPPRGERFGIQFVSR